VVNGVYASRRHCEIWLDHGAWWVTDTGSTNGVRVDRGTSVLGRSTSRANAAGEVAVVEVTPGARIVLSAHAEGSAADYPRLTIDVGRDTSAFATPIAPAVASPRIWPRACGRSSFAPPSCRSPSVARAARRW